MHWSRRAIWIGLASTPACLVLHGLDALDAPWRAVFDGQMWRAAFGTTYALTLALGVGALVTALVALRASDARRVRGVAVLAVLLLGLALAASGHASAAPPQWLARPAVLLHGIALAAWLGAFIPLIGVLFADDQHAVSALRTFSRRIPVAVFVLAASGVTLAVLQLDAVASLWRTDYGRVLLLKLLLVAVLLLLAAWNRYRLTDRVLRGERHARGVLGRVIVVELVVVLCVLGVVALWRFTPPPRALTGVEHVAHAPASVVTTHLQTGTLAARLAFTPAGPNQPGALRLALTGSAGALVAPLAVTVSFYNEERGLEALERDAVLLPSGEWEIAPLSLPSAERWDVQVDVLVTDFDRVSLRGGIDLSGTHRH